MRVALVLLAAALAAPAVAKKHSLQRDRILAAMEAELERAQARLKIGEHEAPYFIGYTLRETTRDEVQSRYGAVYQDDNDRDRSVFVEVRVGSYEVDNSGVDRGSIFGSGSKATYISRKDGPLEDDLDAIRASFWLATDEKYKEALSDYLRKLGDRVYEAEENASPSFSREVPVKHRDPPASYRFDRKRWRTEARRASGRFKRAPEIFDNLVRVSGQKEMRWVTTTEGTRLVTEDVLYSLHLSAVTRAEDGMLLTHSRSFYGRKESGLPQGAALDGEVDRLVSELAALRAAPVIDPFTGPAILAPEATGVLFHEAIGHRLEGERQDDEDSGSTFKGQVGRKVVPAFLTVFDDPNLEHWEGKTLNGHYRHDDEGVKASRALLIERGTLQGYLTSRTPVKDAVAKSNGHGRSQPGRDPMARMGNLVVEADPDSGRVVTRAELKRRLMAEARRQNKPYGLIITDIAGGDTNTSSYGYQAFRGVPTLAYRVDAETGEEELVRGIELVGTPLTVINKIVAASKETDVFNGFCGAESGYVPVSTVAPATLIQEVELQRQRKEAERAPVLPPPWSERTETPAVDARDPANRPK